MQTSRQFSNQHHENRYFDPAASGSIVKPPSRLAFVLAVLFFRLVLDLCYYLYLIDAFGDDEVTPMWLNLQPGQYLMSFASVILIALIVPHNKKNLSGIYYFSILAFLFIPLTSIAGMNADKSIYFVFITLTGIITSLIVTEVPMPRLNIPMPKRGIAVAVLFSSGALAVFFIWTVITGSIFNVNFDLTKIYQLREEQDALLNQGFWGYFNLWAQKVFNPFLFALGLYYRNKPLIVIGLLFQVYFFTITSHRTHLFVPVLIWLVYFLYSRKYSFFHLNLVVAIALLGVVAAANIDGLDLLPTIVIRRAFFVAGSATMDWLSLFESRAHVYFADNLLKSYVSNEYTGQKLTHYVSVLIFNKVPFGFDGGLVGNGYAHLGLLGVVLYAALIGLYVRFMNELIANGVQVAIAAALLFEPLRTTWADTDLPTALITHGLLVGLLLIWMVGKSKLNDNRSTLKKFAPGQFNQQTNRFAYTNIEKYPTQ